MKNNKFIGSMYILIMLSILATLFFLIGYYSKTDTVLTKTEVRYINNEVIKEPIITERIVYNNYTYSTQECKEYVKKCFKVSLNPNDMLTKWVC